MTSTRRDWLVLILAALLLEGLAFWVAKRVDLRADYLSFMFGYLGMSVIYLLTVYYVLHHCQNRKGLLGFGLVVGVALRVTFLFTTPVLSDDIYRYIWDGRVQREGINPYRYPPSAPELEHLRDPMYEGINNKDISTIYPPMMQMVFAASTAVSDSILWMKATFVLVDLALIGVLLSVLVAAGLNPMRSLIYAWSPLVIIEIAGSGHNDVLMVALLMASHRAILHKRDTLSISLMTLSGYAKLMAFALLPLLARWVRPVAWLAVPLTSLLLLLPYLDVGTDAFGGVRAFGLRWRANDSLFHLLYWATESLDIAKLIAGGLFGLVLVALIYRRVTPLRGCYIAIGAILLLSPTVHPWYLIWLIPYLCFYPSPAWLVLTATIVLAYHAPFLTPPGQPWEERWTFKLLEYAPFFLIAGLGAVWPGRKVEPSKAPVV